MPQLLEDFNVFSLTFYEIITRLFEVISKKACTNERSAGVASGEVV